MKHVAGAGLAGRNAGSGGTRLVGITLGGTAPFVAAVSALHALFPAIAIAHFLAVGTFIGAFCTNIVIMRTRPDNS